MYCFYNKKGFALTEVLLSIAVILIVGIVSYALYAKAKFNAQTESAVNDATRIQANIGKMGLNFVNEQGVIGTVGERTLNNLGLLPKDLRFDSVGIYTGDFFNSQNVVFQVIFPGNSAIIQIRNMPSTEYCTKVTTELASSFSKVTDVLQTNVIKPMNGSINISNLETACNEHTFSRFSVDGISFLLD